MKKNYYSKRQNYYKMPIVRYIPINDISNQNINPIYNNHYPYQQQFSNTYLYNSQDKRQLQYRYPYLYDPTSNINLDSNMNISLSKTIDVENPSSFHYNFENINANQKKINKSQTPRKSVDININIKHYTLDSLLEIINKHSLEENTDYNINLQALHNIKESIEKLNNMIGLENIKNSIIYQILYFIQGFHKSVDGKESIDFMHTVLYGPPGTGKTEVAMILGEIYSQLGILKKRTFKKVTRSDLIAGFLGQTALKTKGVIEECLDGVLFIDEAYALGNEDKKDMYAKECLDTLCEAASFYKDKILIIIAGYKDELNKCFFSYNQGLESRFPWRYETDKYNAVELSKILKKKVYDINWSISPLLIDQELSVWFEKNYKYFSYFGRDIENLLAKIKIVHSKRVFGQNEEEKRVINLNDFDEGLKMYLLNDDIKKELEKHSISNISHIYS